MVNEVAKSLVPIVEHIWELLYPSQIFVSTIAVAGIRT